MSVPAASAAAAASAGGVGTPAAAAAGEVGEAESLAYVLRPAPAELEYLAEQQLVTVTPNFTAGVLKLIEADYGPFAPNRNINIPLWLALVLKRRRQCRIHTPTWMQMDALKEKLTYETTNKMFAQMPEYFLEISNLLLENAEDDVPNAEDVRRLLKDITDVRQSKIRAGLEDIKSSVVVNVRNLTPMEINSVRPFFAASMDVFYHMASEG